MKLFSGIPFFRILIPYLAGICLAPQLTNYAAIAALSAILLITAWLQHKERSGSIRNTLIILLCDVFLFLSGALMVNLTDETKQPGHYSGIIKTDSAVTWLATVSDLPLEKTRTVKCLMQVKAVVVNQKSIPCNGKVLVYFKKCDKALKIKSGTLLRLNSAFSLPPRANNPGEFDYGKYLLHRHISHISFVDSNAFNPVSLNGDVSWLQNLAQEIKAGVLEKLRHSGLSQNAFAISSALLTGYDDEIDRAVSDAFAHSGTLHVLSVSGLHTGMIYLVLNFFFNLFDRHNRFKIFRFILVSLLLWVFALFTGFSAPVLRAVIMFCLFGFGKIIMNADHRHQMSILFASAFMMLLYNPFYIYDTGFILSYSALGGIIYFQPRLSALWQPRFIVFKQTWSAITASVAATLGTLPVTLLFFKQFPYWFFICNLVVVPLSFVLLSFGLLIVCGVPYLAVACNYLVQYLTRFINFFNNAGWGYADNIDFEISDFLFLSLFIVLLSAAFYYRRASLFIFTSLTLVAWQALALGIVIQKNQTISLTVCQINRQSAVLLKNKNHVFIYNTDSTSFNFHLRPQVLAFNSRYLNTLNFNLIGGGEEAVMILRDNGFLPKAAASRINTLVVCNNFKLSPGLLNKFPALTIVISDGSNSIYRSGKTEELCRNFGIEFWDTRKKGALVINLNETADRR